MDNKIIIITDDLLRKIGFECVDNSSPIGKFNYSLQEWRLQTKWQTVTIFEKILPNGRVIYRLDGLNSEYNRAEITNTLDLINGIILFKYDSITYSQIVQSIMIL